LLSIDIDCIDDNLFNIIYDDKINSLINKNDNLLFLKSFMPKLLFPELFYWGYLSKKDIISSYNLTLNTVNSKDFQYKQVIKSILVPFNYIYSPILSNFILPLDEWHALNRPNIVLPPDIANLLGNVETYSVGIAEIKKLKANNYLLYKTELSPSLYNDKDVFIGSRGKYDDLVKVHHFNFQKGDLDNIRKADESLSFLSKINLLQDDVGKIGLFLNQLADTGDKLSPETIFMVKVIPFYSNFFSGLFFKFSGLMNSFLGLNLGIIFTNIVILFLLIQNFDHIFMQLFLFYIFLFISLLITLPITKFVSFNIHSFAKYIESLVPNTSDHNKIKLPLSIVRMFFAFVGLVHMYKDENND
jgi:hypothetical protein